MTFVITSGCCSDAACVAVCPVQCIRPRPGDPDFAGAEQLYIDPRSCIDCSACEPVCPVGAIVPDYDLDPDDVHLTVNAEFFTGAPTPEEPAPAAVRHTVAAGPLRVAVVGAGPAALYAVAELSAVPGVEVTLVERLPTPHGLVRYGIAPDHAGTKRVADQFRTTLTRPNVTCLFNVEVGRDLSLAELSAAHHAVIWAAGAPAANALGLPGEDLPGVHPAGDFVAWYNGHPDHARAEFDLSGRRAVVIGNGNVALDVARVLARPAADLARTDIADHALAALAGSAVAEVLIAARKSPHQAACSLGELEALSRTPGLALRCEDLDLSVSADVAAALHPAGPSPLQQRKLALFTEAAEAGHTADRTITFGFGLEPRRFEGTDRVRGVVFERTVTELVDGTPRTRGTGDHVTVAADLVLTATGYRSAEIPGLPFDKRRGRIANDGGRVTEESRVRPGTYCTGWARRGASGVVGTNRADAAEVVAAVLADFAAGLLHAAEPAGGSPETLQELLRTRGIPVLDARAWARLDEHEVARGRTEGRPRVKVTAVEDMLRLAAPR
ncbi:FAD-dependent oxidoreductase [Amycolatopsis rhabdoformis]|uniref:ferredoxin--NADP(+) reductase n=1 Tax=Amycolatopsis rhabdoformis TaxID=1448059 RepID=A0ABZ1IGL5_9PSEU|nr:FAD-dependent oxidoreductase [Amycolatopsis rhabdoformis]WSE32575.1 FAD-dependent oxidoreductase [Amycolatopsis rhabdoformis]